MLVNFIQHLTPTKSVRLVINDTNWSDIYLIKIEFVLLLFCCSSILKN